MRNFFVFRKDLKPRSAQVVVCCHLVLRLLQSTCHALEQRRSTGTPKLRPSPHAGPRNPWVAGAPVLAPPSPSTPIPLPENSPASSPAPHSGPSPIITLGCGRSPRWGQSVASPSSSPIHDMTSISSTSLAVPKRLPEAAKIAPMITNSKTLTGSPSAGEKVSKKISQQWKHPKGTSSHAPSTLDTGRTQPLLTNSQPMTHPDSIKADNPKE